MINDMKYYKSKPQKLYARRAAFVEYLIVFTAGAVMAGALIVVVL